MLLSKRVDTLWILGGAGAVSFAAALLGVGYAVGACTPVESAA